MWHAGRSCNTILFPLLFIAIQHRICNTKLGTEPVNARIADNYCIHLNWPTENEGLAFCSHGIGSDCNWQCIVGDQEWPTSEPSQLVRDNENREGRTVRERAYSLDASIDSRLVTYFAYWVLQNLRIQCENIILRQQPVQCTLLNLWLTQWPYFKLYPLPGAFK